MRQEIYKAIHDRYLQKYWEINQDVEKSVCCRFQDIAANLVSSANFLSEKIKDREGARKEFVERIKALRDYFRLLEKYPEFKKDELSKDEGHFPEFGGGFKSKLNFDYRTEGFSDYKTHYIAYAKSKLEGEKNEL